MLQVPETSLLWRKSKAFNYSCLHMLLGLLRWSSCDCRESLPATLVSSSPRLCSEFFTPALATSSPGSTAVVSAS